MLLAQIHRDLARLRDFARPLRRVERLRIEPHMLADHLLNMIDRNLAPVERTYTFRISLANVIVIFLPRNEAFATSDDSAPSISRTLALIFSAKNSITS